MGHIGKIGAAILAAKKRAGSLFLLLALMATEVDGDVPRSSESGTSASSSHQNWAVLVFLLALNSKFIF